MATLTEELELSRGGVRDQLKELGNSQAMLNDKVAELAEVCCCHLHQLLFLAMSHSDK